MTDHHPTPSALTPHVRAGIESLKQAAVEERSQREARATERRREQADRQASYSATVRQTVEAFQAR